VGEAREVMDRVTEAVRAQDIEALKNLYAEDAVLETPDRGKIEGREEAVEYMAEFARAFSDIEFESLRKYESGDTAIDEGVFVGTHSEALVGPDGQEIPPTGKRIRVREADSATVEGGAVMSHRFYFDQMDFLAQLGLLDDPQ
jgi:ketosteroid isomerase-like protein